MRRAPLCALLAALAGGCTVDPFCLDCVLDGGASPDPAPGDGRLDAVEADACAYLGPETCNGVDDDCSGAIDDGDLSGVGVACGVDRPPCEPGTTACVDGEIVCGGGAVNPAPEECDGEDNDCDGVTDNGNPGGGVVCGTDVGECRHGYTACQGGGVICDGELAGDAEECDGKDNDCDGSYDEEVPGEGEPCGAGPGVCILGGRYCIGGSMQCVGVVPGAPETCDHVDNDCNGLTDEVFDLATDPGNCGDCGVRCTVETMGVVNGIGACVGGDCRVASCFTGRWNLDAADPDGGFGDGCEYACDYRGVEICNGLDDDCDGATDEALAVPAVCDGLGECVGATATCRGALGWICGYADTVSVDGDGSIVPESDCDGRDNDCDGDTDEAFPTAGDVCFDGLGACRRAGTMACTYSGGVYGVACDAVAGAAGTETGFCDGIDQDCDGTIDEGVADYWVQFTGADGTNHWIYQYEASRPDADVDSQGVATNRSCSAPGRLPWTQVTYTEARAACAAVGADLCDEADWQRACEVSTTTPCKWSYGSACTTYAATTCNGNDYDSDPSTPAVNDDSLIAGGAATSCYAAWATTRKIHDLSGNAKELTRRSAGKNPLRGGAFNNTSTGISCGWSFVIVGDDFHFDNVGFRCCRNSAP